MPAVLLMVIGISLSAFLFYSMMRSAENGNVVMVILLAVAISIVAFVVTQAMKFHRYKDL
ncbi:hypothetical protein [Methanolobus halotolerans]|uniref:hypothetical protein n=1 Tax=Methanolobus halotolerans TaxID=2052935 RepID=UPI00107F995F|nr:hypothetical protein [Methanolobus halotolerans]